MNREDDVGAGQHEHVVVAAQIPGMRLEALAAEIRFRQLVALNHRAHGAVEHEDALGEQLFQPCSNICHIGYCVST